jgi:glycosyltransferase involved in cell wall biosynthesis
MNASRPNSSASEPPRARVGVNLLWLVPGVVGGSEYAVVEMLTALAEDPPEDIRYGLYTLDSFTGAHADLAQRLPTETLPLRGRMRPLRVVAEGTWLARAVRRDGVDLMHYAGGTVPVGSRVPAVLNLHDVQPFDMPDNFPPVKRAYIHRMVPRALHEAYRVIVPSEFVRSSVVERFGMAPDLLRVVPWGVAPIDVEPDAIARVRSRYDLPERWFIYPAITYPHKNHLTLLHAFAKLAARHTGAALVLTGQRGGAEEAIRTEITRLGISDRVRRTGRISREDVLGLLAGAVGMTFPSRYEGFGLPVLEAMAASTPVVASNITALPEAVGDAGLLVDPDDADAWSEAMEALLSPSTRDALVEAGRRHAARFSWASTASGTVGVHREVLVDLDVLPARGAQGGTTELTP